MSKKNLSLWMDGFMGEASQAESVQEQAVVQAAEQVEQPAVQDDKQESPKAAPAKASAKKEATELAATKQMKSKLEAKRRENVGRPKKGEPAKSAKRPLEIRATSVVDPDLLPKCEVHFPRGGHPFEGRYLRSTERLCGCLGGEKQENTASKGKVKTCKNGASCYSLLRFTIIPSTHQR